MESEPSISVLVPARNEAHNIEACLRSLLEQDYDNYEVIALDDDSRDGTSMILSRLGIEYARLKVLNGLPLPTGWVGKPWACQQLARTARGEWLLFVDADTRHHPNMLADTAATLHASRADFMTGMPRQILGTWAEFIVVPLLAWVIFALIPVPLARRLHSPIFTAAVGQFMMFKHQAYEAVGGHAAVRDTSIEDIALARRVVRQGLRWDFVDLSSRVYCRMYRSLSEVFGGVAKNLFAVFHYNLPVFAFAWLWLSYISLVPLFVLAANISGRSVPGFELLPSVVAAGLMILVWLLNNLRFRLPVWQTLFYPVTFAFSILMAAYSAWVYFVGGSFAWKGRVLPGRDREVKT